MKKYVLLIYVLQSLLLGNVFAEESDNPNPSLRQPPPPLPIPTRDHSEFPIVNSLPSKKRGIAPTIKTLQTKPHTIKSALNIEQPINHSVKRINVVAVPHNENNAPKVLNVQKPQPRMIKPEMTIQSHKIPVDSKPHHIAAEPAPTTGPIQELHYNQTKSQESITGIDRNNPIGTNSTINVAPRVKQHSKQLKQINSGAQPPNNPPTQHVVYPHKQGIPVLAPKNTDIK